MSDLTLGLDLGTSGIRSAVIDADGTVLSMARASYGAAEGAEAWWQGAADCVRAQVKILQDMEIDPGRITKIGADGTSGSVVLTDAAGLPVTRPLVYNDGGFTEEADRIAALAPASHITRGSNSSVARALRLIAEDSAQRAAHLLHQADFIAARLTGRPGQSDENNALKTGYDPATQDWPAWFDTLGLRADLLPQVLSAGAAAGPLDPIAAESLGLSKETTVHVGTTDSIAAFIAAAPMKVGCAVTSLGSTLAVKLMSDRRIDAPEIGLYSHRLGDGWLVGGASNTGGRVLLDVFSIDEINTLSEQIDVSTPSPLDLYPLSRPGERFPINDPDFPPRMEPRPDDDAAYLHGLLEGMARIEAQCYAAIQSLGAPDLIRVTTAGGGAANAVWTQIRQRYFKIPIEVAPHMEAAIGTAKLIAHA